MPAIRPEPTAWPASINARSVWRSPDLAAAQDRLIEEVPIQLRYNGEPHAVMMATPGDLEDFARGFSLTEDIVHELAELEIVQITALPDLAGIDIALRIPPARAEALQHRQRHLQGRTGCGLCGAATLETAIRPPRRVPAGVGIHPAALRRALAELPRHQPLNAQAGAVHAAAWVHADGAIAAVREDVGRHNALDKLIGHLLVSSCDRSRGFGLITSRASFEMVQKASVAGFPLLAAISAPTAYAARLADEAGMTLLGFARGDHFVVYSCPGRIVADGGGAA